MQLNTPFVEVFVRKEFLTKDVKDKGQFLEANLITCQTISGVTLLFEVFIPEYYCLYDKLSINSFVWKKDFEEVSLDKLARWDSLSYASSLIVKDFIKRWKVVVMLNKEYEGEYLFTIVFDERDNFNGNASEHCRENKCYNVIKLDNGMFCYVPNNKMKIKYFGSYGDWKLPLRTCKQFKTVEGTNWNYL